MNTYTDSIKQKAICEVLADLFKGTCEYSDLITDKWNDPIEPDVNALNYFRSQLSAMAVFTRIQDFKSLKDYMNSNVIPFVRKVGVEYGHVTGNYTTGVWGVRYSTLNEILTIIEIDDIPNLYGTTAKIYDLDVKITSVKVTSYSMWYELTPLNPEIRSFQIDFSWNKLKNHDNNGLIICEK
jgi:hypothetical protein